MSVSGNKLKKLFIGIGNNARGDDAIGWLLADFMRENYSDVWQVEYRYQLQVEDAELISHFEEVIFADATEEQFTEGFSFQACQPSKTYFYSSHLQTPETVLYISREVFDMTPVAYILMVTGYEWDLGQHLSDKAGIHLRNVCDFLRRNVLA